jgi:sulfatase maturation enzyme AslB (radical SAM superfamily)
MISTANDNSYHHCCYSIPSDQSVIVFKDYAVKNNQGLPAETDKDDLLSVWNSEFYKRLRKDLLTGNQNPACNYCWQRENLGVMSYRQKNQDISDEVLKKLNDDYSLDTGPQILDIKIGNFCNLKCIMCHPVNSTEHVKEIQLMKQQGYTVPSFVDISDDQLSTMIKHFDSEKFFNSIKACLPSIKEFQFYGGEPLATIEVLKFLDLILTTGYRPKIKIITNLSITNEKIFAKLEQFDEVELIISWDHTDPTISNYIRHPLDHAKFLKNLDRVVEHPSYHIAFSPTISVFNIFNVPDLFEAIERINLKHHNVRSVSVNILEIPRYFSLRYLDDFVKITAKTELLGFLNRARSFSIFKDGSTASYQTLESLITFMTHSPEDYLAVQQERSKVLEVYDVVRKTNSKSLFPYLY